ncbi:ABC transporter ATP-binding protein [Defluviimonas sp. D31]|uniref:ABC transporter ATP-binding protein n=1 Tax=Defluviimonas sp. D31 TaxID=3083253 RepID=UPI00296FB9B8|nr:ABC transporter ATP-binding protein [Defluviimonas sp. D31]MDW4551639.1 ABC transporter ATP-binding protein [Defluviimonas sp. D31]
MAEIVKLDRISKHFGPIIGVDDISLSVAEGEFVTLLGPSGCGKSTLLRIIGGFDEPTQGAVMIGGRDVTDLPPSRRPVNMVFQDYALFPHMSVGKNVGYGLRVGGLARAEVAQKARDALDLVGLPEKFDAAPHELSGGQRQRVALARAIVRRPQVLLLDEPLSALDANLRLAMQVELKHLHQKVGLTFIMVTHDQNEALAMSDRIVVMREGRIVQEGTPEALYDAPDSPYVAGFIGTTNLFDAKVGADQTVKAFGQSLTLADGIAAPGRAMTFGFRPEKAVLLPASANAGNTLRGRVADLLYQGNSARIIVDLGGGQVAVDMQISGARRGSGVPEVGDEVQVQVAPDRIMALEATKQP